MLEAVLWFFIWLILGFACLAGAAAWVYFDSGWIGLAVGVGVAAAGFIKMRLF